MISWIRNARGSLRLLVPLLLVAGGCLVTVWDPLPLQILRNGMFDQFQRWQPRVNTPAPVRIIDIDDESLRRFGQWPWPRTRLAELVAKLQAAEPASIALDILFVEPDRTSPNAMLNLWQLAPDLQAGLSQLPDHDVVFGQTISHGKVVLGSTVERSDAAGQAPEVKARFVVAGEAPQPYLHAYSGSVNPLPVLQAGAAGVGAIAFAPDADGVIRKVPMVLRVGDTLVPSLAAEALRVAEGVTNDTIRMAQPAGSGVADIRIGQRVIPTTPRGEVWLHYAPPLASRYIPAWKVLTGEVPAAELTGNILLVGTSAQGLMDLRFGTLGAALPGVEVHAQVLEQVLSGGGLQQPAWAPAAQVLAALVGGVAVGLVALFLRAAVSASVLALLLAALWAAVWQAFSRQGLLVDAVAPTLTMGLSYVGASMVHHMRSEQRQRWIRQAFSRYVSPNLVDYLIKQPEALELGGKRQQCSFVFTDLTGFTSWVESMDPASAVATLNEYLDGMIAIAFSHQATLDRIVGDALVLMFSAPVVQPDHPRRALACAWEMHQFSNQFVARLAQRGVHFGLTRIGVHTGEVIVGNFGGSTIFDYRALGDPINTAARLESANKQFGTWVCVSEATLNASGPWPVRPIGQVVLKGKTQIVRVFEPLAPEQPEDSAYLQAFKLLQEESPEALAAFEFLAEQRPDDRLVAMHLARLQAGQRGDRMVLSVK